MVDIIMKIGCVLPKDTNRLHSLTLESCDGELRVIKGFNEQVKESCLASRGVPIAINLFHQLLKLMKK